MLVKLPLAAVALAYTVPRVSALPPGLPFAIGFDSAFKWGDCDFEVRATVEHQCSNFTVPLDYLDTRSEQTLELQVVRVPAVKGKSRGSILFNFGGPGAPTRQHLVDLAEMLFVVTGGQYDLVG